MASPFPGMDPYLEGYLWPDVYNALAAKIREQLTPQLRPRYTARLEIYTVEDDAPESEFGIMYPDVEVVLARRTPPAPPPSAAVAVPTVNGQAVEAPLMIPVLPSIPVRIVTIAIRDPADNQLITTIELLPVNKREPGLKPYLEKRQRLFNAGVHVIELDLLRRGTRAIKQTPQSEERGLHACPDPCPSQNHRGVAANLAGSPADPPHPAACA